MAPWLLSHITVTSNYFRHFVTSAAVKNSNAPTPTDPPQKPKLTGAENAGIRKITTLTRLQKWALVFSGKYKAQADIPQYVPIEVLERARSRARIKLSNILIVLTLIGCLSYAYSGRAASRRGESVTQMNIDWHKEYNEQVSKEKTQK